jgi:hypothetical protein
MDLLAGKIASTNKPIAEKPQAQLAVAPLYVASDIKRFRRTKAAMATIKQAILDILEKDNPQTVRQVFYALTAARRPTSIENSEDHRRERT